MRTDAAGEAAGINERSPIHQCPEQARCIFNCIYVYTTYENESLMGRDLKSLLAHVETQLSPLWMHARRCWRPNAWMSFSPSLAPHA